MNWWKICWSGRGRQRQQREESMSRLTEASMQGLTKARIENEQASRAVKVAVDRRFEQSEPLRRVLSDLLARVGRDERFSPRKDRY